MSVILLVDRDGGGCARECRRHVLQETVPLDIVVSVKRNCQCVSLVGKSRYICQLMTSEVRVAGQDKEGVENHL